MRQELREAILNISKFNDDSLMDINRMTGEIDAILSFNESKAKAYAELKSNSSHSGKHLILANDIFAENFKVVNLKMKLTQFYLKDMYDRIETIGKAVEYLIARSDTPHSLQAQQDQSSHHPALTRLVSDITNDTPKKKCGSGTCSGACR